MPLTFISHSGITLKYFSTWYEAATSLHQKGKRGGSRLWCARMESFTPLLDASASLLPSPALLTEKGCSVHSSKINYPIFKAQAINIPYLINAEAQIIFLPGDAKTDS